MQLPYSPFPAYSFEGPDLSNDGRVEIKIDDHYFNRSDAAVVFRRRDRWSGDTRYVYHGNDGTSFPWNDTAQLNYLIPEVREAVIQTILHVARLFPIIRFDAAMTLTKQHYQRLWFPVPGTGGAIPSRAEHGLTKAEFDAAMPQEFWRELVDRVAAEVPGTLLLAEAFWLLEGYFVRTLGMHRVYNSAFMNMMRDEENANYRCVIKNTLEFDPEVLKRYVNFMNNPDERTAVDQFGKGDKYFGVCTMMATLPGLPMFGHGQIEGFTERYGMEYRRAYNPETPDPWLVARHEREISPLLHRRALFAEVRDFLLYDFYTDQGHVNEDVFAYSNRLGDERALVIYNNRYSDTRGWVRQSCAYAQKAADGGKSLRQRTLGEALGLSRDPEMFLACRDSLGGLEYLHRASHVAERGMYVELGAYKHYVFLDWRDLRADEDHPWGELCEMLGNRGVSSLDDALRDLRLRPVHDAIRELLDAEIVGLLAGQPPQPAVAESVPQKGKAQRKAAASRKPAVPEPDHPEPGLDPVIERVRRLLSAVQAITERGEYNRLRVLRSTDVARDVDSVLEEFVRTVEAARRIPQLERLFSSPWPGEAHDVLPSAEPAARCRRHLGDGAGLGRAAGHRYAAASRRARARSGRGLRSIALARAHGRSLPRTRLAGRAALAGRRPRARRLRSRLFRRRSSPGPIGSQRDLQLAARPRRRLADRRAPLSGRAVLHQGAVRALPLVDGAAFFAASRRGANGRPRGRKLAGAPTGALPARGRGFRISGRSAAGPLSLAGRLPQFNEMRHFITPGPLPCRIQSRVLAFHLPRRNTIAIWQKIQWFRSHNYAWKVGEKRTYPCRVFGPSAQAAALWPWTITG